MYRTDLYKNFDQENMLLDLNSRVTMEINPAHVVKLEPINDILAKITLSTNETYYILYYKILSREMKSNNSSRGDIIDDFLRGEPLILK
jgi:hypothetical protein